MRVIGVLDLMRGRAVHAQGGSRDRYAPVHQVAGAAIERGDAVALARAYVMQFGLDDVYVADLDAIMGGPPQDDLVRSIASLGMSLWLDAGVVSLERARHAADLGAAHVIVGLETLPAFGVLSDICDALDGRRVAFSLDLRDRTPITAAGALSKETSPEVVARNAADTGAAAIIVLDLARVGTGAGIDIEMVARIRDAVPEVMLVAGGGLRGVDDLVRLRDAGCEAVLVASALHDGRLTADDVASARRQRIDSR